MVSNSLPSPPAEDHKSTPASRKGISSSSVSSASSAPSSASTAAAKPAKPTNRVAKRSNSNTGSGHLAHHPQHDQGAPHGHGAAGMDGRHKRVWKACERCRMKKTKCDGEFPCKRCKDDGMVCTAGVRKKVEYKQLPKGYAEVLEHTQFALIATVHKLYSMVRNSQSWELGEPELNDRGQPVIHNIAQKLGCIRPNSDVDLPVHSVFPEDEAGMAELARQLEEQQQQQHQQQQQQQHEGEGLQDGGVYYKRAPSSDLDPSDSEFDHRPAPAPAPLPASQPVQQRLPRDYRGAAFGGGGGGGGGGLTVSPQGFTTPGSSGPDLEFSPTAPEFDTGSLFTQGPPYGASWHVKAPSMAGPTVPLQFFQGAAIPSVDMAFVESEMGMCSTSDVMMGIGDPMICSGAYDGEPMRL